MKIENKMYDTKIKASIVKVTQQQNDETSTNVCSALHFNEFTAKMSVISPGIKSPLGSNALLCCMKADKMLEAICDTDSLFKSVYVANHSNHFASMLVTIVNDVSPRWIISIT